MSVHRISQKKVVEVGWDTKVVLGSHASMQLDGEEKRSVENDGKANLTFSNEFTGTRTVTIRGSRSGEETGTISVS